MLAATTRRPLTGEWLMRCSIASPRYRPGTSTSCQRGDLTLEITAGGPISAFVEAAARNARVCTRLATRCHEDSDDWRGRPGIPLRPARRAVFHPCPREGGALSNSLRKKGLFPASVQGRLETQEGPASEEAGLIDPDRSGVATAGPDQVEAVVTLAFHQRGIDRRRKTRIVDLDREIFAIAVPRGLLPGGAAFDGTCDDPIVGRLVVVLFGREEL